MAVTLMQSLIEIKSEIVRLKWFVAASRFQSAMRRHALALEQCGFNPNQPRVPAGRSNGGQWTSGDSGGGGVSIRFPLAIGDGAGFDTLTEEGAFEDFYGYDELIDFGELDIFDDIDLSDFLDVSEGPGIGHNQGPPIEDPSDIPEQKPETIHERNRIARQVSRNPALSTYYLLTVVAQARHHWLTEMHWEIKADQDLPKTLDELHDAVFRSNKRGYDDHHIVERLNARTGAFPSARVYSNENTVSIPRYKHEQINRWYQKPN